MITHITDSIAIHRKNRDFFFCKDLFFWHFKGSGENFGVQKKLRKQISFGEEIIGICTSSNYRLQYELKNIGCTKIYYPEFYEKRKLFKISPEVEFDKYLKRSYLSLLNYDSLKHLGLNRIEQFLVCLTFLGVQKKFSDNIYLKGFFEEIESKIVEYEYKKFKIINVLAFLESKGMPFSDAFRFLLSQAGSMNISDPFLSSFALLSKIEHGKELLSCLRGKYKETKCKIGDKYTVLKTFDSPYHLEQLKEYKKGDWIEPDEVRWAKRLELAWDVLKDIMPLKDFLMTVDSLKEMGRLDENLYYVGENLFPKDNVNWISKKTWAQIYKEQSYSFNDIIDLIRVSKNSFECPLCGNNSFRSTPISFYCKCGFSFKRKSFNISISQDKMIEALKFKKLFLKTKTSSIKVELKNKGRSYFLDAV